MFSKPKLIIFDYMRIISAFFVFLFHSNMHLGITYGIMTPFVTLGAIFMSAFFMLSGVSLTYNYETKELLNCSEYGMFIKKRIISIYPGYLVLIVMFFVKILISKNLQLGIVQHLVISPVELSLLQSVFGNSYLVLHNSGTWFISCIFLCYLLFPFLCKMIMQLNKKQLLILSIILFCILSWAPIVEKVMNFSWIYPNPFFRILEFTIGICIWRFNKLVHPLKMGGGQKYSCVLCCFILQFFLFVLVSLISNFFHIKNYCFYNCVSIPIFFLTFYFGMNVNNCDKIMNNSFFRYCSKVSYIFFLAQFFTWDTYRFIQNHFNLFASNNILAFILSFFICSLYTLLMYEILVNPITKLLKRYLLKEKSMIIIQQEKNS